MCHISRSPHSWLEVREVSPTPEPCGNDPVDRLTALYQILSARKLAYLTYSRQELAAADDAWCADRDRIQRLLNAVFVLLRQWLRLGLPDGSFDSARAEADEADRALWALFHAAPPHVIFCENTADDGTVSQGVVPSTHDIRALRQLDDTARSAVARLDKWRDCHREIIPDPVTTDENALPSWITVNFNQKQFQLLRTLWGRDDVPADELAQLLGYPNETAPDSLRRLISRVNEGLTEKADVIGEAWEIGQRDREHECATRRSYYLRRVQN
jgi:hypothetical protein